jgi:UDP-sugar transporter A1/2/3
MQLYLFGMIFGLVSLHMDAKSASLPRRTPFDGFNAFAYATVATLAICGLLVSFILKYLDNVAKCFCAALSMLCVALLDSAMKREMIPLRVVLGMILTGLALEQYNLS